MAAAAALADHVGAADLLGRSRRPLPANAIDARRLMAGSATAAFAK
jgi:hypothetical protein